MRKPNGTTSGSQASARPRILSPVRMPDGMYDGPADIMAQAEKTNPKLAAYVDDIRAAQADKELAEAARQPVLNLQAGPQTTHRGGPGGS